MSANGKTPFLSPQQQLFISYYIGPKSPTFSNAYQSAIRAGYTENYAKNIMAELPEWLVDNMGDMQRLRKAEKVLDETLEMNDIEPVYSEGEEIGQKRNPALTKIKQDSAKFIAERLNKEKYSTRNEVTGKDGKDLVPDKQSKETAEKALDNFLDGKNS